MRIGQYQELRVDREMPQGFYLSDGAEEVLLPRGQCPPGLRIGDTMRVFVLTDSEDRPVATVKKPLAAVGEFAMLKVVGVTGDGAYLDWGLDKDLFCPIREQRSLMRHGSRQLVRIYLDEVSGRVACSAKIGKFLQADASRLVPGQAVEIIVAARKPDLIGVIVDNRFKGSLFPDEWHEDLEIGEVRTAYVKSVRPADGRLAISLRPQGYKAIMGERERLLQALEENDGSLAVSDKSSPEEIGQRFGLSKAAFKKLIGALYKEGKIELGPDSIRLKPDAEA